MGVTTYTQDIVAQVDANRIFKALVLDADNIIPKLMSQAVKNIETIEDHDGNIKKMNFVEGINLGF